MYVTDTHALAWYLAGKFGKLSKKVRDVFDDANKGRSVIVIPSAVLWEISINVRSGGSIRLTVPFLQTMREILRRKTFIEEPITSEIIAIGHGLDFHKDPFDALIVATALYKDLPLISNDSVIHQKRLCELFWD